MGISPSGMGGSEKGNYIRTKGLGLGDGVGEVGGVCESDVLCENCCSFLESAKCGNRHERLVRYRNV